jgi:hypothetical protein
MNLRNSVGPPLGINFKMCIGRNYPGHINQFRPPNALYRQSSTTMQPNARRGSPSTRYIDQSIDNQCNKSINNQTFIGFVQFAAKYRVAAKQSATSRVQRTAPIKICDGFSY